MKLPREEILKGFQDTKTMQVLLDQAELVLRTWQSSWSEFISAPIREEAIDRLSELSELAWICNGGYQSAERQRLYCRRKDDLTSQEEIVIPIQGIEIQGNFLFDPGSPADVRAALEQMGVSKGDLGDIWMQGDRGAQAICSTKAASQLNGKEGKVRNVQINIETLDLEELRLPIQRIAKKVCCVEASTRIDAIASAGFGISRAKIVSQIKAGKLRLNWKRINQPSKELLVGDRLQLQNRGTVEVLSIVLTKRQRWKIELLRQ